MAKPKKATETPTNITELLAHVEKTLGSRVLSQVGDAPRDPVETVPTGSLGLDTALGIGGLPRGRIVEIYGPESAGKTTLALQVIAQAQARGIQVAFIDAEHALDTDWAGALGVDVDALLLSQPDNGEQALELACTLADTGLVGVIVVDSVAALTPRAELEGEMGDSHVALQARMMSQGLRKLTASVARGRTLVIFINQLRSKVGLVFGSTEATTGGNALKYYASVRLDVRKIGKVKDGDEVIAARTRVKVVKNKMARPFREAEFDLGFGAHGIPAGTDRASEVLDTAVAQGHLDKRGAHIYRGDTKLGASRTAALEYLRANPDILDELHALCLGGAQ